MPVQIRPIQIKDWFDAVREHGQPMVLDVREPHELRTASIKVDGFEFTAIPMGVIPPRIHELNPDQPVACLCHHGARSMQVAYFLEARGFKHVANVAGGIDAWSSELDPGVPRY